MRRTSRSMQDRHTTCSWTDGALACYSNLSTEKPHLRLFQLLLQQLYAANNQLLQGPLHAAWCKQGRVLTLEPQNRPADQVMTLQLDPPVQYP